MPLSEHEQRLLDQIERALYQEDPKFASTVRQTDLRTHMKRRLLKAAFVLVAGFALLLTGVVVQNMYVGIAGFLVMVGALLLAMTAWKRLGQGGATATPEADPRRSSPPGRPVRPRAARGSGGLVHRLEERWKRRWDERGQ
ncbi:MAG TPA: DUF3040 domain-containing protein [Mycobacteriales bacterium]|nr:DUF3040 domain-containing protein [Mycobacteriales bacterium]